MVIITRYAVIFQKFPSRVRVAQKIPSSIRVAGTRWGLIWECKVYSDNDLLSLGLLHTTCVYTVIHINVCICRGTSLCVYNEVVCCKDMCGIWLDCVYYIWQCWVYSNYDLLSLGLLHITCLYIHVCICLGTCIVKLCVVETCVEILSFVCTVTSSVECTPTMTCYPHDYSKSPLYSCLYLCMRVCVYLWRYFGLCVLYLAV